MKLLTDNEKEEIKKKLKRASKFVWKDKNVDTFIDNIDAIRAGTLKRPLNEPMSKYTTRTWFDYFLEMDMLKFVDPLNKASP